MKPSRFSGMVLAAVLTLFTLTLAPTSSVASAESAPAAPDRPAVVLSFNIHHGASADNVLDLQRIADLIRDQGADIAGLQEVDNHWGDRSEFVDQANWLAKELNMHVVYGANLDLDPANPGEARRQYGTAILSDAPILNWDNTLLPWIKGEQRGLLRAKINVRGVPLQVYNTHLEHTNFEERNAQVQAIKTIIGTPSDSVIVTGDMNATPDAPEIADLVDGLVDAWEAGGAGDGYTYPVEDPSKRIDYVLNSDDVVVRSAAVIASDTSDHLPIQADVLLPGSKVGIGAPR